jgi:hypothetical protein
MPKVSHFAVVERSQLRQIACRMRVRMFELGLSGRELAERCDALIERSPSDQEGSTFTRDRIAKILMNCRKDPRKSAAKVITWNELRVLAQALKVSPEWLIGQAHERDPILWDVLAHSNRAEEIVQLMNYYEEKAKGALVWAEHLMCSLTTPEFMHAQNEVLFCELDQIGLSDEKRRLVKVYDQIGNVRRDRQLRQDGSFIQLMLLSDLEKIAYGTGEYCKIQRSVRRSCLENLRNLLRGSGGTISLVVSEEGQVRKVAQALRRFDSVGVCRNQFVLIRTRSGDVIWSENKEYVNRYAELLSAFLKRANYRDESRVLGLLDRLLASMR